METNDKAQKELVRKTRSNGTVTQRMVNFRCDNENVEWLKLQPNKGRYINELIAADRRQKGSQ